MSTGHTRRLVILVVEQRCFVGGGTRRQPRHSTTEGSPPPDLEELHTSPQNWLREKSNAIPMNNAMAPTQTKNIFFLETILAFRRFWVKEPRYLENISAEVCYSYL